MESLSRDKQIKFYEREIQSLLDEYALYFKSNISDLRKSKELFLGTYLRTDNNRGNIIVKFRKSTAPALKVPLLAIKLPDSAYDFSNWDKLTFESVRAKSELTSDLLPIFIQNSDKDEFIEMGFSQAEVSFENSLTTGQYILFGRKEPPIQYYTNLITATKQFPINSMSGRIIDNNYQTQNFSPKNYSDNSSVLNEIKNVLSENDVIIIQGPPGTGKTTLLSDICSYFLSQKKSILVSSLTNRALIELAKKDKLNEYLLGGKVYKSNLNTEEERECIGLKNADKIFPSTENLMLTTYYKMSGLAVEAKLDSIFDYVILEEASQSFLGTIACARALGRKFLIVGDHLQLPPVVTQNNPSIIDKNIDWLIYGLKHFAAKEECPKIRLTSSYRLLPHAVKQTGIFYENTLNSLSNSDVPGIAFPNLSNLFNKRGGSSVYFTEIKHEGKSPNSIIPLIIDVIIQLQKDQPAVEVAILTAFRKTRTFLQDKMYTKLQNNRNVVIETIDRIQGLTCDFTIFIIPYENPSFSFNLNRFNVATSRARFCTLLITDTIFREINPATGLVAEFWNNMINASS